MAATTPGSLTRDEEQMIEWLEERQSRFVMIADEIWANPELALAEFKACKLQSEDLAADGFTITTNIGDMPTAFMAEYTHGEGGPIIGFLGEYDALPQLSQERSPDQQPIVHDGPGHGCGHNLLGTAALASASVLKAWLQATDTAATVRYYGCPAEETCEGKVFMARAGAFDDLDVCFTWHPSSENSVSASSSLAVNNIRFKFRGRTAHAAANPETGRSALDAVELMNIGVNYMREHVAEKVRMHYVITNGGGAPNVVPDEAEVWYFLRAPERYQVEEITERVRKIAQGAAMMTETTLHENFVAGAYNLLPNMSMVRVMEEVMESLGELEFDDEEIAFGKRILEQYPEELRRSVLERAELPADAIEAGLWSGFRTHRNAGEPMAGSTDVGDVSWITPTGWIGTTCFALGAPGHSWAHTATSGVSIGHKGMIHAAKGMAISAARYILDPSLIKEARDEFAEATKGRPYKSPIPPHVMPRKVEPTA
jgi:aminobenzoyl-glutamate utilization protein B